MKIVFGYNLFDLKKGHKNIVYWDSQKVINHHILMMGASGTGKTHTLKSIVNQLQKQDKSIKIHVFDFHGDIDINGSSKVKFSESTDYGLNPLIVNDDPDFGGVRKKIQSFILALSRAGGRTLGSKQEAGLRNLLTDLYAANGFYIDKPNSWKLDDGATRRFPKKYPTIQDAVKFSNFKLNSLFLGSNNKTMLLLEQLNRATTTFYRKQKSYNNEYSQEDLKKIEGKLEDLKAKNIEIYSDYINSIKTGAELTDLIKYDSKDVLKSIVEKLENLNSMGIFKNNTPPFEPNNNVWRYEISSLLLEEKRLFVNFVMEQIFNRRFQEGAQQDVKEFIILDEANLFFTDDNENIINVIAKEARKFGLGLICASQSPTHFSEDFTTNVSCKIILGIDESFWVPSAKKLNINPKSLEYITPQKNMLIQIKNKGDTRNTFTPCQFQV